MARITALMLVALLLAAACSLRRQPPPGASGAEICRLQNCANCQGDAREGTRRGPPLSGLAAHCTAAALAEYLLDPPTLVARDARLAAVERDLGGSQMGRYDNLDAGQRATLAAWLLADGASAPR